MNDAILLAGDRYHKADDAFAGVGPALESAGLSVLYTTDYEALNADLLKGKRLLAILRDGMLWPNGVDEPYEVWMKSHQEAAIEQFVAGGAGVRSCRFTMLAGHIPGKTVIAGSWVGTTRDIHQLRRSTYRW